MYKHNKETIFLERAEMAIRPFFEPFFKTGVMPEGVVSIRKVANPMASLPMKYVMQLGGVTMLQKRDVYEVVFACRKHRDAIT